MLEIDIEIFKLIFPQCYSEKKERNAYDFLCFILTEPERERALSLEVRAISLYLQRDQMK